MPKTRTTMPHRVRFASTIVAGKASKLRQERAASPKSADDVITSTAVDNTSTSDATSASPPRNEAVAEEEPPLLPANASAGAQLKQYGIWLVSFLAVIGTFYSVVFYAGAGMMYFVRDNVDFTKKDFVPYSERLALEAEVQARRDAEDRATTVPTGSAPSLSSALDAEDSLRGLLPSSSK